MPNRILKESICTSEDIDRLDSQQESFFYRLIVVCDDFGLMDARLSIIKAKCFPLKSIDINCIQVFLGVLQRFGLIRLYEVAGKPYLKMLGWERHQQIRAKRAKYPLPEEGTDITCNRLQANAPVIQSNPIQSESNLNPIQQKQSGSKFDPLGIELPDCIRIEDWTDWVAYRSRVGKKPIEATWRGMVKNLAEWSAAGTSAKSVIEQSISNGWQGLFLKTQNGVGNGKQSRFDKLAEVSAALTGRTKKDNARTFDGSAERLD